MEMLLDLLKELLFAVITAAVPIISYYITKFLKASFEKVMAEKDNQVFNKTLIEVHELIESVVTYTSQTYVDSLKAEGKFDKESQEVALNDTLETVKDLLSEESKEVLETLYQDVETWLLVQIESKVKKLK